MRLGSSLLLIGTAPGIAAAAGGAPVPAATYAAHGLLRLHLTVSADGKSVSQLVLTAAQDSCGGEAGPNYAPVPGPWAVTQAPISKGAFTVHVQTLNTNNPDLTTSFTITGHFLADGRITGTFSPDDPTCIGGKWSASVAPARFRGTASGGQAATIFRTFGSKSYVVDPSFGGIEVTCGTTHATVNSELPHFTAAVARNGRFSGSAAIREQLDGNLIFDGSIAVTGRFTSGRRVTGQWRFTGVVLGSPRPSDEQACAARGRFAAAHD